MFASIASYVVQVHHIIHLVYNYISELSIIHLVYNYIFRTFNNTSGVKLYIQNFQALIINGAGIYLFIFKPVQTSL